MQTDQRSDGFAVDLEKLEKHAEELYLHRFVDYVRKVAASTAVT